MRGFVSLALTLAALPSAHGQEPARRGHDVAALMDRLQDQSAPTLGLVRRYYTNDGEAVPTGPAGPWFTAGELERWAGQSDQGGGADVRHGRLTAELDGAGEARLATALVAMRAESRRAVSLTLELVALTPEQERALRGGAGAPLDAEGLAALAQARRAGGRLSSLRVLLRDGERAAESQLVRTTFLADREVNQTGTIPVLQPVVEELLAGAAAEVALSAIPGEEARWILDARVERSDPDGLREAPLRAGQLQLPAASHLGLSVSLPLGAGEVVLLGAARVPGADGPLGERTLAITCRAEVAGVASAAAPPAGVFLRRHSLRAVLPPRDERFLEPDWGADQTASSGGGGVLLMDDEEEEAELPEAALSPPELADRVMGEAGQGSWEDPDSGCWVEARGPALIVAQTREGQAQVAAYLRREAAELAFLQHELLVLAAPEGDELPHLIDAARWDALLAKHPVVERLLLCGQAGQRVEAFLRREARVVVDVEGYAFQDEQSRIFRIEDPMVDTVGSGTRLGVRGRTGADGWVSLEVEADLRDAGKLEQVEGPEGPIDRHVGARHAALVRRAELAPGQALAWELGSGKERRLVLIRTKALR